MSDVKTKRVPEITVNGVTVDYKVVTPRDRAAKTTMGAFDTAVSRMRAKYEAVAGRLENDAASFNLLLTIEYPEE